jgi:hopanoid biosynthesis associated RND transporter like protein HpnN
MVIARPWLSLLVLLAVTVLSGLYTARNLKLKTDRTDLIDPTADFQQRWLNYTQNFGESSDIVVVVEADSPDIITAALDDLGERLRADERHFRNIFYKVAVDQEQLKRKGLQFLSPAQLELLLSQLNELRPVIQGDWEQVNLENVLRKLLRQLNLLHVTAAFRRGNSEADTDSALNTEAVAQLIAQHVTALATSMSAALRDPNDARNPWPQLIRIEGNWGDLPTQPVYSLNERGTMGFLQVVPVAEKSDFNGATEAIQRLRHIIADVQLDHPDVKAIGLTGIPVLENDEMLRSQSDMSRSTIVSAIGVLLLLLAGFHGFRHPLLAMVMLICGLLWSCAYATVAVGHLTILSASFAAILMGLGIDFAIVYLSRYLELRHTGQPIDDALGNTSASIGTSILTASATSALAFYCATFTRFLGVAELGMIAGGGLLLCALAAFTVLPALIRLADRHVAPAQLPTPLQGNVLRWTTRRFPWVVAGLGIFAVGFFGYLSIQWHDGRPTFAIRFDYNLLNLQADGVASVKLQQHIFEESDKSLLYAVSIADSAEEASALKKKFEALPTVAEVREIADLAIRLPLGPPKDNQLLIQAVNSELAWLAPVKFEPRSINPEYLGQLIERLQGAITKHDEPWAREAARALDGFLNQFEQCSLETQMRFLNEFQARMNLSLHSQLQQLADATDSEPLTLADVLPPELISRFVSPKGQWLLRIFPKSQVWDIDPLREFVEDVRSIDPNATGTPLQNFEASRQIAQSYQQAAIYAVIAIGIVLLVDVLGRNKSLLVLVPTTLALAAIAGFCRWQEIKVTWGFLAATYLGMLVVIGWIVDRTSVSYGLLALFPPFGGMAIMFGWMHLMQVDLNPANLIVLPLLLGIGVDGGVHVVHDFRWQTPGRYRISRSIINSLVLTSTTTIVGFSSMLLAAHRGLFSFGLVLTLGVASSVFVALVPLPAMLTLLDRNRHRRLLAERKLRKARAASLPPTAQSVAGPRTAHLSATPS